MNIHSSDQKKTLDNFLKKLTKQKKNFHLKKNNEGDEQNKRKNNIAGKYIFYLSRDFIGMFFYLFSEISNNPMRALGRKQTNVFLVMRLLI